MVKREVIWTKNSEIQLQEILNFSLKETKADFTKENFIRSLRQHF